jgi:hypothetical protein
MPVAVPAHTSCSNKCPLLLLLLLLQVGRHISDYIAAKEGSHPYRVRLAELGSGTMLQVRQLGLATLYVMYVHS